MMPPKLLRGACRLQRQGFDFIGYEFELARVLTHFSSEDPCPRAKLDLYFFVDTNLSASLIERRVKQMIENLRKDWLLPIGSRKSAPAGYWILTSLEDYKEWVDQVRSAPITQLSTIHKNARHNFPEFAEQMELEFWRDLGGGDE